MTVVSQNFPNNFQQQMNHQQQQQQHQQQQHHHQQQQQQQMARQCATLPRKMPIGQMAGRMPAPMPPRRDPKTTLSVGRARAKSMVAGLENDDDEVASSTNKSSSAESIHQQSLSTASTPTQTGPGTPVQPRTASIKARPTSSRITAAELEELFQRQQGEVANGGNRYSTMMTSSRFQSGTDSGAATPPTSPHKSSGGSVGPIVYASVADMKRKKNKNGTLRGKPCAIPVVGADLKRTFHSTPDLATNSNGLNASSIWSSGANATAAGSKGHRSQDDMHILHSSLQRLVLPPPNHPPPPPPVGQVVKVEVSRGSEYDSTVKLQKQLQHQDSVVSTSGSIGGGSCVDDSEIRSSFKPAANAKLYALPQDIRSVGYRSKIEQNQQQQQQQQQLQQQINAKQPVSFIYIK